ncbi:MAG TPA: molybdopterin-binding protein, partial [Parachlamydiaceae bacterium]|nr:molybdopterin-binding protein [Parachlamydiaceae bacterium]
MPHQIEIIAIGNELLKGIIVNSNAAEIASALFKNGYSCSQQFVIPDERESIKKQILDSLLRNKIVITTGGLGPTCDDITRQVAAEVYNSDFSLNAELAEELKQRYGNKQVSVEDQATVPIKASILKNPLGTAPGIVFNTELGTLILLPGVPKEMRGMLHDQVIPYLKSHFPISNPPISRSIHLFNISESAVDPSLRQLEISFPHVEFGIYPSHGLISIHATINAPENESGMQLDDVMEFLKAQFTEHYYSDNSGKIEMAIQDLFIKNGWTLCTAESCSGGAIASRLTKIQGASEYYIGGCVTYSNSLKEKLLHVD